MGSGSGVARRVGQLRGRPVRLPFRKPSEADKRAVAARSDLEGARAALAAIETGRKAAQTDSLAFAKWDAARATAALEVARLIGLAEACNADAETARLAEETEAVRKRLAAARKDADDLAKRIRVDGERIAAELLQLLKDCAQQALEAKELNRDLPTGEAPVPVADILARDLGSESRKDIRSRDVELWVVADDGRIVGDQSAVVSSDGITGQLHLAGAGVRARCARRKFRETEYHPSTLSDWPGDLHSLVRLPRLDGPGFLFDGSRMIIEQVAALDVVATVTPTPKRKRPVQTELRPIEAWPPANAEPDGEAERDASS